MLVKLLYLCSFVLYVSNVVPQRCIVCGWDCHPDTPDGDLG